MVHPMKQTMKYAIFVISKSNPIWIVDDTLNLNVGFLDLDLRNFSRTSANYIAL